MKTTVEKLYFNWQDINTGEMPKSYQIQVHTPGENRNGDLMSHRVLKLLTEHRKEAVNFPKSLMIEVYEDFCRAQAGYLVSSTLLQHYELVPHEVYCGCLETDGDKIEDIINILIDCATSRVMANFENYFDVAVSGLTDEARVYISKNEILGKFKSIYSEDNDPVLQLDDSSEMAKITWALLNLRKGTWSAFRQNAKLFLGPYDDK